MLACNNRQILLVTTTGAEVITMPNHIQSELAVTNKRYIRKETPLASPWRKILSAWGTKAATVITEATVPI